MIDNLQRAIQSLEGLACGDCLGGFFEGTMPDRVNNYVKSRRLPIPIWRFTDDTNMAMSIVSVLRQCQSIDQGKLARSFGEHYDRSRDYRLAMRGLLTQIREGMSWQQTSASSFGGRGSFGNGAAMCVPPLGAYFANNLDKVVEQAKLSAEITHAHSEGIAGAMATALGAAIAWQYRADKKPPVADFLEKVLEHVPEGEVRDGIVRARSLRPDTNTLQAAQKLGNGSAATAVDTVPFVLWVAAKYLDHYEEAIWQTISAGGDADTTAAMVGGIVVMYTGTDAIPHQWRTSREPLPQWYLTEETG